MRIDDAKKGTRIAHVFKLQGKEHKETDSIVAGDIGAVAKLKDVHTGNVLTAEKGGVRLAEPTIPR